MERIRKKHILVDQLSAEQKGKVSWLQAVLWHNTMYTRDAYIVEIKIMLILNGVER